MKYVSIRMPEPGPFGETLREARTRAIVAAFFVNKPGGGWVESVVTPATQRRPSKAVFVGLLLELDLGTSQSFLFVHEDHSQCRWVFFEETIRMIG